MPWRRNKARDSFGPIVELCRVVQISVRLVQISVRHALDKPVSLSVALLVSLFWAVSAADIMCIVMKKT